MWNKQSVIKIPFVVAALLLAISCTPSPQATPAPSQVQQDPLATTPAAKLAPADTEDLAWAQVVSAAKKEGKVTLYTWGVTGQAGVKVGRAFKATYGIEVETVTGVIPTLIERLKTEQAVGKHVADTFDASTSSLLIIKDAGLSQPIGYLPALRQKNDFRVNPLLDSEGQLVSVNVSYRAILINTNLVKPSDEPKSWQELTEPKWKGKIVLPSPVTAVGMNALYAVKDKFGLDDEYFRRLVKNDPIVVATDREAADMVIRGEAQLYPSCTMTLASPAAAKGAPVKGVFPPEGVIMNFGNTWSIIKNAPHPNAAKVFLNWLLLTEGQNVYGEASAFTPMRADTVDFLPGPLAVPGGIKAVLTDVPMEKQVADLRTNRTVAKLMGIEK